MVFFLPLMFFVIYFLTWLICLISCIAKPIDSSTKILWVLVLFFVPFLGVLLYLLVGPKAQNNKQPLVVNVIAQNPTDSAQNAPKQFIVSQDEHKPAVNYKLFGRTLVYGGLFFLLFIIGIPALFGKSRPYNGTPIKTYKTYTESDAWHVVRQVAFLQNIYHDSKGRYAACKNKSCEKILDFEFLPEGYSLEIAKSGNDDYKVKVWNSDNKNQSVEADSSMWK